MDQISEMFANINWDDVLTVVSDYVTKINVGDFLQSVMDFFMGVLGVVAGDLLAVIMG